MELNNETSVGLLYALKDATERVTKDLLLPVKRQERDKDEPKPRRAEVFLMRLPDMTSVTKKAPYIIHQFVTGEDTLENVNRGTQKAARWDQANSAVIRSIFCVYHPDEQEGALALLNLMERLRAHFLAYPILKDVFELDVKQGLNRMVYQDNGERQTAPYYLGEMVGTWKLPPVTRIDAARVMQGLPARDPGALRLQDTYPKT